MSDRVSFETSCSRGLLHCMRRQLARIAKLLYRNKCPLLRADRASLHASITGEDDPGCVKTRWLM
jgi:hypothetical protein